MPHYEFPDVAAYGIITKTIYCLVSGFQKNAVGYLHGFFFINEEHPPIFVGGCCLGEFVRLLF